MAQMFSAGGDMPQRVPMVEVASVDDAVAAIRPTLERVLRGEWRILVTGPASSRERDEAALFSARLVDLADAVVRSK